VEGVDGFSALVTVYGVREREGDRGC
jgi:hypothetical protein